MLYLTVFLTILVSQQYSELSDTTIFDSLSAEIETIDSVLDVMRGTPNEWPLLLRKAELLLEMGDTARAKLILNSLMRLDIDDSTAAKAYLLAAELAESDSAKAQILAEFSTKYPFASGRRDALLEAAALSEKIGMKRKALELRKMLASDYRDGRESQQCAIARLRLEVGDPQRAVLLAKRLMAYQSEQMQSVLFRGQLLLGDTVEALLNGFRSNSQEVKETEASILLKSGYWDYVVSMLSSAEPLSPRERAILSIALADIGEVELALGHVVQYELFDEFDSLGFPDMRRFFEAYEILNNMGDIDTAIALAAELPDTWPFLRLKADIVSKMADFGSDSLPYQLVTPLIEKSYYPKERTLLKIYRWMLDHGDYPNAAKLEVELSKYGYAPPKSVMQRLEEFKAYAQRLYEATGDTSYAVEAARWDSILSDLVQFKIDSLQERFDVLLTKIDSLLEDGDTVAAWSLLKLFDWNGFSLDEEAAAKTVELAFKLRRYSEAESLAVQYLRTYQAAPHRKDVLKLLGLVYVALGKFEEAVLPLYGLVGEDREATNAFAYVAINLGHPEIVKKLDGLSPNLKLRAAVRSGDLSIAKNVELGMLDESLLREFLVLLAEREPDRAFKLADSLKVSYILRAEMAVVYALKKGDFEFAKKNALSARSFYRIGVAYMRRGKGKEDLDSALVYLQKAFEMGELADAAFKIGSIHYAQNRPRKAIEFYRLALKCDTLKPLAFYNIGMAFKSLGEIDSATRYLNIVVDSFGTDEISLDAENSLAFIYQDELSDFDRALRLWNDLEGELQSYDDEVELKYWKAEALLASNRTNQALLEYLKVVKAKPKGDNWRATAMLKAAKIYAILGKSRKAEKLFRQLIDERGPGDQLSIVAEQELQKLNLEEEEQ